MTDPGNAGFEVVDDVGTTRVEVSAPDAVTLTLSGTPSGANERVRYAYTGTPGHVGGPGTGPRGNLRDSDATPSRYGNTLYNW